VCTALCVGAVSPAAVADVDIVAHAVASPADAMRALACADFDAVLFTCADGRRAESLANEFARLADLRSMPRWLLMCSEADRAPCTKQRSAAAMARAIACVTAAQAKQLLRQPDRGSPQAARKAHYLDAVTLRKLEQTELEQGEFLAGAFEMYGRQARRLVEESWAAALALEVGVATACAHALLTMSKSFGDLHTAQAACELWASSAPDQLRARVAQLREALAVGLRSLETYLAADAAGA